MTDTTQIAAEDRRLEGAEYKAGEALAAHRWHWTLDESNPERLGIKAYARLTGRSPSTISRYVNGYAEWQRSRSEGVGLTPTPLADHIETAGRSEEYRQAQQQVATAHSINPSAARQQYPDEIRRVREAAQDAPPERRAEVGERTAKAIVASRKIARQSRERLSKNTPALSVLIEGELGKAHDGLIAALSYARQIDPDTFPKVFLDKIGRSLDDLDALAKLVRTAIGGAADDIDWDAELAKLPGGAS